MKGTHIYGKNFITFQKIKWESLTARENTIPRITGILKEFISNIIKVIVINVNPIVPEFTLNSLIIIIKIVSTGFARKVY